MIEVTITDSPIDCVETQCLYSQTNTLFTQMYVKYGLSQWFREKAQRCEYLLPVRIFDA